MSCFKPRFDRLSAVLFIRTIYWMGNLNNICPKIRQWAGLIHWGKKNYHVQRKIKMPFESNWLQLVYSCAMHNNKTGLEI